MRSELEAWLEENTGISDPEIVDIREGEGNRNFIVDADQRYVARVSKEVSKSRLQNEYEALSFLASEDIEDIPSPVCFENNTHLGPVLVENFVGSEDIKKGDYTSSELIRLAKLVAEIHCISVERYNSANGSNMDNSKSLRELFMRDFCEWGWRPYKEYLELADDPRDVIKNYFRKHEELVGEIPDVEVNQAFTHGDLGFNCRRDSDGIYLIDWEFARIDYPGNEILYFFEHADLDQKQQELFLEEYRRHRDLGEAFDKARKLYPKFLAFNDMIWAAKRVAKGEDKHRGLLEDRLERLSEIYD